MELATCTINLSAIKHNLTRVKQFAPHTKVLAMLKAAGYGHDAVTMAKTLTQADAFGVARIGEAIELVDAGISTPIVLMEGCFDQQEYLLASEHSLQVVIHSVTQLKQFLDLELPKPIKVWLKVETGMHRLGIEIEHVNDAIAKIQNSNNQVGKLVVLSHLANADAPQDAKNNQQLELLKQQCAEHDVQLSMANSAAIVSNKQCHLDWVRPGIMLFGATPVMDKSVTDLELIPAMTFSSRIIAIKSIKAGDSVGYGSSWQAKVDTQIAVVAIGYGDGYPRQIDDQAQVYINDQYFPIVGKVSMDMITVNVGDMECEIGDSVELWGANVPVEDIAASANTISYQLYCGITNRVKKRFID